MTETSALEKDLNSRKTSDPVTSSHIIVALAAVHVCATFFPRLVHTEPRPDLIIRCFSRLVSIPSTNRQKIFLKIKEKELGL